MAARADGRADAEEEAGFVGDKRQGLKSEFNTSIGNSGRERGILYVLTRTELEYLSSRMGMLTLYAQSNNRQTTAVLWDDRKAVANRKKHGVSFEESATVLDDPLVQIYQDQSRRFERQIWVGHSVLNRLLLVVVAEKSEHEIRIISARKPTARERKSHEEGIRF